MCKHELETIMCATFFYWPQQQPSDSHNSSLTTVIKSPVREAWINMELPILFQFQFGKTNK